MEPQAEEPVEEEPLSPPPLHVEMSQDRIEELQVREPLPFCSFCGHYCATLALNTAICVARAESRPS